MLMQGINVKVCQKILGHADLSTTLGIYSHVLPSVAKEAAQKIGALVYEAG
jgi:integrase